MAIVAVVGAAGLAYALATQTPDAPERKEARDQLMQDAREGQLATQQAAWTREQFRPYWHGSRPFARRHAQPDRSTQTQILEDASLTLSDDYKRYMREQIADSEFDDIPFRGERAAYWSARERRRMPFVNNPGSEGAWVGMPALALEETPALQNPNPKPDGPDHAMNLYRLNNLRVGVPIHTAVPLTTDEARQISM